MNAVDRIPVVLFALLASTTVLGQATPDRTDKSKKADKADKADKAELDRTPIIGNRELPKVLYIVPWKKPLPGELSGKPPVSVLDEALAPIDRDVFRREVRYDALAVPKPSTSLSLPAAAAKK